MMECKKRIKNCRFGSLCRVLHSAKDPVAECHGHSTRQTWKNGRSENHFSSFAECHDHGSRQRFFLKKIQTLPSAGQRALGKEFFFKKNQTLPSASQRALGKEFFFKKINFAERRPGALGKDFFFKKIKNLCRVPAGLALGKETVNGAGAMTVAFLCRVSPGL